MRRVLVTLLISGIAFAEIELRSATSGSNSGDVTLGAVGSSPNGNGASLSGQVLNLQPASQTQPGAVTAGAQDIGGAKTFYSTVTCSACSLVAGLKLIGDTVETNSAVSLTLKSSVADGGTAKAVIVSTSVTLTGTAKLISFQNNGTEKSFIWADGTFAPTTDNVMNLGYAGNRFLGVFANRLADSSALSRVQINADAANDYRGNAVNGATAIGHRLGVNTALSTAGSEIVAMYSDDMSTKKAAVRTDGSYDFSGVATGSLLACAAGTAGVIQYDTTTTSLKLCNGTAWTAFSTTLSVSGTQDVGSVAASTCSEFTQALTGAVATDKVACAWPTGIETGLTLACRGGTNIITYRLCNVQTVTAIDPASGTYGASVIR